MFVLPSPEALLPVSAGSSARPRGGVALPPVSVLAGAVEWLFRVAGKAAEEERSRLRRGSGTNGRGHRWDLCPTSGHRAQDGAASLTACSIARGGGEALLIQRNLLFVT